MESKLSREALKLSIANKERCPSCHFPFIVLTIDTPVCHYEKCLKRKTEPKNECPQGTDCSSDMVSHYRLFSHKTSSRHHRHPSSVPSSPKQSQPNYQLFSSLHGKNRLKESQNATPENVVDLTENKDLSQEILDKSKENVDKNANTTLQMKVNVSHYIKIKPEGKKITLIKPGSTSLGKHKLSEKKLSQKSKKKKVEKTIHVKIEESINLNPWTITASQVAKSPRRKTPIRHGAGKILATIDLTDSDVEEKQEPTEPFLKDPNAKRTLFPDIPTTDKVCSDNTRDERRESRINLSKHLSSWLDSQMNGEKDSQESSEEHRSDCEWKASKVQTSLPKKVNDAPLQSTQKPAVEANSPRMSTELDTGDSEEDWLLPIPVGPGFVPVTPIRRVDSPDRSAGPSAMISNNEADENDERITKRTAKDSNNNPDSKCDNQFKETARDADENQDEAPSLQKIKGEAASQSKSTHNSPRRQEPFVPNTTSSDALQNQRQNPVSASQLRELEKETDRSLKTKQGDIGSMLFGMKPKEKPKENFKPVNNYETNYPGRGPRKCPFYKKIDGTDIAVDAFSYGTVEGIQFYLLSHFHYDHYRGLTKKDWKHKVYCSQVTGNLVAQKLRLPENLIERLPMYEEIGIGNTLVTLLEANHCPGAVLFLFKLRNNKVILHTGDFRAHPDMEDYDQLQGVKVHTLYLDTTYLNPNYRFPLQRDVIKAAVNLTKEESARNPKTLFVVGTYLIGKERIFQAVAKAIGSKVLVAADKFRTVQCLDDGELSSLVYKKLEGARVHVVAMKFLNVKDLKAHLTKHKEFEEIIAIKPTGWTHDEKHPALNQIKPVVSGPVRIYGLPYSEHSSFQDLRRFVKFLKPTKIIPTVNVAKRETRDQMSLYLDKWKLGLDYQ